MDIAIMSNLVRELTDTNDTDFPNTRLLPFFNAVKDDLFSYLITGVDENYNWDIWETKTVSDQSEYTLPEAASDSEWSLKINGIWVNYDGDTYPDGTYKYTKAKRVKLSNLQEDWNYYKNYQSQSNPIYFIADKSIFLAPIPSTWEAGDKKLQLKGIRSIVDYTVDTVEGEIGLPSYLHMTLVQGVLPFVHKAEWRKDEASFEQKEYIEMRDSAVLKFSNRDQWPYYMSYPCDKNVNDYEITTDNLN